MVRRFSIETEGGKLIEITDEVEAYVASSGIDEGICHIFIQHTSASLCIQENADPTAKADLERWICRLIPEGDKAYTHTSEGSDDMPSHIKSVITNCSLSIPILDGRLALGTWQGIYLWEHRRRSHQRNVVVYLGE